MKFASIDAAKICRALSVDNRVGIVRLLAERSLCVGALANQLGVSAAAVSQHLRVLRDAGLVEADRRGYFTHYRLAPDAGERTQRVISRIFAAPESTSQPRTKGGRTCAAGGPSATSRKT
jgi:DNA-binding transcriptional ArsR family regulator